VALPDGAVLGTFPTLKAAADASSVTHWTALDDTDDNINSRDGGAR
jgi:hypothetical protein